MYCWFHIPERVYQSYDGQGADSRTQQYLQEAVKSGTLVCLICIDGVKRLDPVSVFGTSSVLCIYGSLAIFLPLF